MQGGDLTALRKSGTGEPMKKCSFLTPVEKPASGTDLRWRINFDQETAVVNEHLRQAAGG